MACSPALLLTLLRLRRRLRRDGLRAVIEEATPADRLPSRAANGLSECEQQVRAYHEDDLITWWLVTLRVRAICLYQCLVMLDRLSRLPYVETLELVISAQRAPQGVGAHSWIVANGEVFRRNRSFNGRVAVVCRLSRRFARVSAGSPSS